MGRTQRIQKDLEALIESALDGKATSDKVLAVMARLERGDNETVRLAAHELVHFLDDADIRSHDRDHDQLKREELQKWLGVLRTQRCN